MYTVLHSLCTLLCVIGQGIISITQSSCHFSRFHNNNYYNVANPKKNLFVIDVEIKFHPYHSMHDVNVSK